MRHRCSFTEPLCFTALWSWRLSSFGFALACVALILIHESSFPLQSLLYILGLAILCSLNALFLGGTALLMIWRKGMRGIGLSLKALTVSVIVLFYPSFLIVQAFTLPPLREVSTDLKDPPLFSTSEKVRHFRSPFLHEDLSQLKAEVQKQAYPDLQTLKLDLTLKEAWPLIQEALKACRWTLIETSFPIRESQDGHIEASVQSFLLKLPYDITLRIRNIKNQTEIDIRAATRFNHHDLGENATLIRSFTTALQTVLEEE